MLFYKEYDGSPVGQLILVCDEAALHMLILSDAPDQSGRSSPSVPDRAVRKETPVIKKALGWLDMYFAGKRPDPSEIPLAPQGSAFRQSVWNILLSIPYGSVTTYGKIAAEISALRSGQPMSAQAIGGAVGSNPLPIIIPCHRVIGADGSLTGYSGGLNIKLRLLCHEGADTSKMFIPACM